MNRPRIRKKYDTNQSPFYCLNSKKKLAKILCISIDHLHALDKLRNSADLYLVHDIFDKNKKRRVEEPKHKLKQIHKRVEELLKRIQLPEYIHAPSKGRSYITNAQAHKDSKEVRTLDIEKYFPSTTRKYVFLFFIKQMNCSPDVAGFLAKILTFEDRIPTGSPLSPLLSYFSHMDMWERIYKLVNDKNCLLTVYIDDITVSGDFVSKNLIWAIKKELFSHKLKSNIRKEKYFSESRPREITGVILTVNGKLRPPNRQYFKIHNIRKEILASKDEKDYTRLINKLKGLKAQVRQIERENE